MKKYLRSNIAILALLAMTSSLASCSKKEGGPITVTWWNNYVTPESKNLTDEEAKGQSTYNEYFFAKDVIAKFEEDHPNIKVNMIYKGSYNEIASEIKSGTGTGNFPSLASGYPDNTAVYADSGIALDVKDLVDDKRYGFGKKGNSEATYDDDDEAHYVDDSSTSKSDYNAKFLEIEKEMYSDHLYSLPYSKSSETLLINQDIVDKVGAGAAGTTTATETKSGYTAPVASASKVKYELDANQDGKVSFGELIELGRKAKADFPELYAKDSAGNFTACPIVYDSGENLFITACQALGVDYLNASGLGVNNQVLFNNADAKKVVTKLKEWYDEGILCTKDQLYITDATRNYHQYPTQLLHDGKAVAIISSTAGARYVADEGYRTTVTEVPYFSRSEFGLDAKSGHEDLTQQVISQGPSITFFQKDDKRIEKASFEFYKYLTNSTNSAELARKTSYFPLRTSSNDTIIDEYKDLMTDEKLNGSTSDKQRAYTGKMFELNNTYSTKGVNFMTQAFTYSAASRTAVGRLLSSVFSGTDVETAFTTARNSVVG